MNHQDYLDEQMQDPEFRFWWYIRAPRFWLQSKLASFLFWLAGRAHAAALWVIGVSLVEIEEEM